MAKIFIIGPAHPLRGGGISTFNQRLCKAFTDDGHDCSIYSFSLQYPSFLFPGTSQYSSEAAPENMVIHSVINSINPFNWLKVGNRLRRLRPDIVVVRYWLPFMAPALGTILRRIKRNGVSRIIAITDNIIPHEKRPGDAMLTAFFLKSCDAFVTMSENVLNDLRTFEKNKPAVKVFHPLYDNFGEAVPKEEARRHLGLNESGNIILFFGFIRRYKGLDILLDAINLIQQKSFKLLIAGEFYEDEKLIREQIRRLKIEDHVILNSGFIPDSEVRYYLCAADMVVQPYRSATQSGVTPLAYHFEKPMVVTNVGSLPAMVPDGKTGIVCEPEASSIANAIKRYFELGEHYFIPHLREEKKKYSWSRLVNSITGLAGDSKIMDKNHDIQK